jgi:ABC-2 type transport system permease protein
MNMTLLKHNFKSNWVLLLVFFLIMTMYQTIIIGMYDPSSMAAIEDMLRTLPEALIKAMNFESLGAGLTPFVAGYFYGFLVLMFPMIYCILLANRLVARHVDQGSMAYLLSTPNSRKRVLVTQGVYILLSIALLMVLMTMVGIVFSGAMFPGELDIVAFLKINLATLFMIWAISSICFFFSCLFNDTKYALSFGGGIPVLFFLIHMLSQMGGNAEKLKYGTIFALYDAGKLAIGTSSLLLPVLAYGMMTLVLYGAGIVIFDRKDLPI